MSVGGDEREWELRFTWRALEDLRAEDELPGLVDDIRVRTPWGPVVERFAEQRTLDPRGTEPPIRGMGRNDIYPLHGGRKGFRAVTWFDEEKGVCWFLGFTPHHDYTLFETRQQNGELLPDAHDYIELAAERDTTWHLHRAGQDLNALVKEAVREPNTVQAGFVGDDLACEVFAEVLVVTNPEAGTDIWIAFKLSKGPFAAWLPPHFEAELLAYVDNVDTAVNAGLVVWWCPEFPSGLGPDGTIDYRPIDPACELAIRFPLY